MNKELTEVIFILDRSGSMSGLEMETIGGYNGFLEQQKKQPGKTIITTVLFDDQYEILYNGVDAADAGLTTDQYYVRGRTALLDAVGKTILDVKVRLARTPAEQRPGKVIMVITTDGYENASQEFSGKQVHDMILRQQQHGWEFLFFGANIDTVATARKMGIREADAMSYESTAQGMSFMMNEMSARVDQKRRKN